MTVGIYNLLIWQDISILRFILKGSKNAPPNFDAVRGTMPVLSELLQEETEASVKVVLWHFIIVHIHPYMDGNSWTGRFIMNAMLASGGYQWTVIPVDLRKNYMAASDTASVQHDIKGFAKFIATLSEKAMKK